MNTPVPNRFEHGAPMLVAGIRRQLSGPDILEQIAKQWHDFHSQPMVPECVGDEFLGLALGGGPAQLDYLCGVTVSTFSSLPVGRGRARVPAVHYAVFSGRGSLADVYETWSAIRGQWFSESGFRSAHTPDFERYPPGFDWTKLTGAYELWVGCVR